MGEAKRKPVIGLTTYERERRAYCVVVTDYVHSVFAAGGLPLPVPTIPEPSDLGGYLDLLDGLLFTGGADVHPGCYGEEPLKEVNGVAPCKDACELGLLEGARARGIPILGVCRGSQIINVGMGGTLYQDLHVQVPGAFGHAPSDTPDDELYHSIQVVEGSRLEGLLGSGTLQVNSFHHQAVKDLAPGLRIAAKARDGVIEAIEGTDDRFLLGVQWHPECLTRRHPEFLKLFRSLVDAAAEHRARTRTS